MDKKKLAEFALYGGMSVIVIAALYWLHNRLYPANSNLPNAATPTIADFGISDPQGLGGALTTPYGENVAGQNGTLDPGGGGETQGQTQGQTQGGGNVIPGGNAGGNINEQNGGSLGRHYQQY